MVSPAGVGDGCSCDPAINTTDCDQSPCTAFMGTFLFIEIVILFCYTFTIIFVEIKSRKKSALWRIILPSCGFACLAKVIRLGILANPDTRFGAGQVFLVFLYNTHLCFATIGFVTLLFFWARLRHDLKSDNRVFGRLKPLYIGVVVFNIVFYYAQVIIKATMDDNDIMFLLMLANGLVSFVLAAVFLGYTVSVWHTFLSNSDTRTLFYKTYVSALLTSIFIIAFCVELLISNVTNFDTTSQYLIKHAVYEILFIAQFCSIPSGFVIHYYRHHISKSERTPSEVSINSSSGKMNSHSHSLSPQNSSSQLTLSRSASIGTVDTVPA